MSEFQVASARANGRAKGQNGGRAADAKRFTPLHPRKREGVLKKQIDRAERLISPLVPQARLQA